MAFDPDKAFAAMRYLFLCRGDTWKCPKCDKDVLRGYRCCSMYERFTPNPNNGYKVEKDNSEEAEESTGVTRPNH